jgi:hypothetical protein
MGMIQEFKEFAMKGNVLDMAVGVVIGGAFGKIVSSFVGDVIMPLLGTIVGGVDFSKMAATIGTNAPGEPLLLRLPDHRRCDLPGGQGNQQAQDAATGGRARRAARRRGAVDRDPRPAEEVGQKGDILPIRESLESGTLNPPVGSRRFERVMGVR